MNNSQPALILQGEFDKEGTFVYLPISYTGKMTELFKRLIIKYFREKKRRSVERFALNLLSWKNNGLSVNNTIRVYGNDNKAKRGLIAIYSQTTKRKAVYP